MSLRAADKKISKKKQIYRPILDNPFTNEGHMWPHVEEQPFVWELLESTILSKARQFAHVPPKEWPWDIVTDFNEIARLLDGTVGVKEDVILYVCVKDSGVSSVLLQQIPLLCYMYEGNVTLVQLARGALPQIRAALAETPLECKDGLLMVRCNDKINENFVKQVKARVAPLQFPWLDKVKYLPADVKMVRTLMPAKR